MSVTPALFSSNERTKRDSATILYTVGQRLLNAKSAFDLFNTPNTSADQSETLASSMIDWLSNTFTPTRHKLSKINENNIKASQLFQRVDQVGTTNIPYPNVGHILQEDEPSLQNRRSTRLYTSRNSSEPQRRNARYGFFLEADNNLVVTVEYSPMAILNLDAPAYAQYLKYMDLSNGTKGINKSNIGPNPSPGRNWRGGGYGELVQPIGVENEVNQSILMTHQDTLQELDAARKTRVLVFRFYVENEHPNQNGLSVSFNGIQNSTIKVKDEDISVDPPNMFHASIFKKSISSGEIASTDDVKKHGLSHAFVHALAWKLAYTCNPDLPWFLQDDSVRLTRQILYVNSNAMNSLTSSTSASITGDIGNGTLMWSLLINQMVVTTRDQLGWMMLLSSKKVDRPDEFDAIECMYDTSNMNANPSNTIFSTNEDVQCRASIMYIPQTAETCLHETNIKSNLMEHAKQFQEIYDQTQVDITVTWTFEVDLFDQSIDSALTISPYESFKKRTPFVVDYTYATHMIRKTNVTVEVNYAFDTRGAEPKITIKHTKFRWEELATPSSLNRSLQRSGPTNESEANKPPSTPLPPSQSAGQKRAYVSIGANREVVLSQTKDHTSKTAHMQHVFKSLQTFTTSPASHLMDSSSNETSNIFINSLSLDMLCDHLDIMLDHKQDAERGPLFYSDILALRMACSNKPLKNSKTILKKLQKQISYHKDNRAKRAKTEFSKKRANDTSDASSSQEPSLADQILVSPVDSMTIV